MNLRIASCSLAVCSAFAAIPLSAGAAPTVSFVKPTSGATLSGSISQSSACEVSGSNIKSVRFYLDSTALNTESAAPWNCNIDTRKFSNGTHTLKAVAYDSAGVSRSTQISVNIQNGTSSSSTSTSSGPTVSFKAPADGQTLSGAIKQSSACEVAGSGISKVIFFLDGTQLNTEGGAPWNCNLDTRKFSDGTHALKAVAYNSAGASSTTQIAVNIKNGTTTTTTSPTPSPYSVSFKTPADNQTLSGEIKQSSACEVVGTGIKGVQFYLDSTALNKESAAPWNCNIDTKKFSDGAHTLKAVATYTDGKTGAAQIPVTIKNGTSTTTTTTTSPAVATYTDGKTGSAQTTTTTSTTTSPYGLYFKTPAANQTLSGEIKQSSACEVVGTGIKGVQFYLDSTALNKESAAPWNCNIDTRKFSNGAHTLKAVATYTDGKTGNAQIAVNINNGTTPIIGDALRSTGDSTDPAVSGSSNCANPSGGYEGFGRNTTGGAGKPIYRVTNLNDSGAGSLREALSQGNRCVVFDVGGTISASGGNLLVRGANVTIDGLTAPSPGITLRNRTLVMQGMSGARNIVVRGIRVRGTPDDGIRVYKATDIVIDRVSVSGFGDGAIDVTESSRDVTIQWSILGAGDPSHNFVNLIGYNTTRVSVHHNLYVNGTARNPQCANLNYAPTSELQCDVRNNVIWNYGQWGTSSMFGAKANVVNNYYYSSKSTAESNAVYLDGGTAYVKGNYSRNGYNVDVKGTQSSEFPAVKPTTTDALTAAREVVAKAGARGAKFGLDATDQGYIGSVSIQ